MKYDYVEPSLFGELALKTKNGGGQKISVSPLLDNIDVNYLFFLEMRCFEMILELLYD